MERGIGIMAIAMALVLSVGLGAASTTIIQTTSNTVGSALINENFAGGHTFEMEQIQNAGTLSVSKVLNTMPAILGPGINAMGTKTVIGTGATTVIENMVEGGINWQLSDPSNPNSWYVASPTDVSTAYISEGVSNTGTINIVKNFNNPYDWKLDESKTIFGTGSTTISKTVGWWSVTNDPNNVLPNENTKMAIGITFFDPQTSYTVGGVYTDGAAKISNIAFPTVGTNPFVPCPTNIPLTSPNLFTDTISTQLPFTYTELVKVNPQN